MLEMNDIVKVFGGVRALKGVNLKVKQGTVHALLGENGAGKSTLMNVLAGIHQPDGGDIILRGEKRIIESPTKALSEGISMIHQELMPIAELRVFENVFLGRESLKYGLIDSAKMRAETQELFDFIGISIDPSTYMKDLKVSDMQLVEIAKAVSYDADIIIMDEPTSAITDREVDNLFRVIEGLKEQDKTIIYISHKMDEIFRICDDITVLRDGEYVGTESACDIDTDGLISMMVGRKLDEVYPDKHKDATIGDVILEVENLTKKGVYNDISFELRRGEILGISGLMGAGRTETMESIFGMTQPDSGRIKIDNQVVDIKSPAVAIKHGMAFVTEDRKSEGLMLPSSVKHNITISSLDQVMNNKLFIKNSKENTIVDDYIDLLNVRTASKNLAIEALSGGNQQKAIIARWMMTKPKILILDEPTRGIDIGAKSEIYRLMNEFAAEGMAIIMISSELPEVIGVSDRVIVFHEKHITGEILKEDFSQEYIMEFATGQKNNRGGSYGTKE